MPFTFSHPAIVLPFKYLPKKWFSMTGLIVGSCTPDFEYFIRMSDESRYSHTFYGIFWFDLPLGILLCFIFQNIVATSFISNLPEAWDARLSNIKTVNWSNYFKNNFWVVCISIVIGAASHIFWDGFTHRGGYFVGLFPSLTTKLFVFGYQIPLYTFLQHVSTLIGGLVVLLFAWKLPPDNNLKTSMTIKYWGSVFAIAIIIILIRFITGLKMILSYDLVMTVISAGLIAITLTPMLVMSRSKGTIKN